MKNIWMKFWAGQSGTTTIEYRLIAASISLAIIEVVNGRGNRLSTRFASISTSLH